MIVLSKEQVIVYNKLHRYVTCLLQLMCEKYVCLFFFFNAKEERLTRSGMQLLVLPSVPAHMLGFITGFALSIYLATEPLLCH